MTSPSTQDGSLRGAFDNGARGRFNAWFFSAFDRYINHVAREHKAAAFAGIPAGTTVVEIGAGVGANLCYLPFGTRLIAVEPNRRMHARLRRRCTKAGLDVTVVPGGAERLPLADASADEVICSLVLCTVPDPGQVLAEVRRVLRPGGRFRFVEHIAAPPSTLRATVQRAIRRPWSWLFEGCDLVRHTPRAIDAAGFSDVELHHLPLRRSVFYPVNTVVWGIARAGAAVAPALADGLG